MHEWHDEDALCDYEQPPDRNTLHVRLFAESPDGRFAAVNPEFARVEGDGHEDEY